MSAEDVLLKPERKPIPWDTVLHNSFLASQGDPDLQNLIFYYLLTGPLRAERHTLKTHTFKEGIVAQNARNAALSRVHVGADELVEEGKKDERFEAEGEQRDTFRLVLDEIEAAASRGEEEKLAGEKFDALVGQLLTRDKEWYNRGGRPVKKDQWASFIIDFCIFKTGMKREGFNFSKNLLPPFQKMCEEIGERIQSGGLKQADVFEFNVIVDTYLAHHPRLSKKRRNELIALTGRL